MLPHRLHLLLAACLGALTCLIVPLGVAHATAIAPVVHLDFFDHQQYDFEASPSTILSNTLPFSRVVAFATSSAMPDVMAVVSETFAVDSAKYVYGAAWSNDGGRNWWPFTTVPATLLQTVGIAQRTDPNQSIRFLLGSDLAIYRTGDFGLQWAVSISQTRTFDKEMCYTRLIVGSPNPQALYANAKCYYPPDTPFEQGVGRKRNSYAPSDGYYTPGDGYYTSDDGGVTWQDLPPVPGRRLWGLVPSPSMPNRLYAGDGMTCLSIQSNDNGQIWQYFSSPDELVYFTQDRTQPGQIYGLWIAGYGDRPQQRHLTTTVNGGVWRDWASSPCSINHYDHYYLGYPLRAPLVSTGSNQLWVRCLESLEWHYSGNGGDTWQPMGAADAQFVTPDYGHPGHALMVNSSGLWRSVDGGEWQLLTADFSGPPPTHIYLPHILH